MKYSLELAQTLVSMVPCTSKDVQKVFAHGYIRIYDHTMCGLADIRIRRLRIYGDRLKAKNLSGAVINRGYATYFRIYAGEPYEGYLEGRVSDGLALEIRALTWGDDVKLSEFSITIPKEMRG